MRIRGVIDWKNVAWMLADLGGMAFLMLAKGIAMVLAAMILGSLLVMAVWPWLAEPRS